MTSGQDARGIPCALHWGTDTRTIKAVVRLGADVGVIAGRAIAGFFNGALTGRWVATRDLTAVAWRTGHDGRRVDGTAPLDAAHRAVTQVVIILACAIFISRARAGFDSWDAEPLLTRAAIRTCSGARAVSAILNRRMLAEPKLRDALARITRPIITAQGVADTVSDGALIIDRARVGVITACAVNMLNEFTGPSLGLADLRAAAACVGNGAYHQRRELDLARARLAGDRTVTGVGVIVDGTVIIGLTVAQRVRGPLTQAAIA